MCPEGAWMQNCPSRVPNRPQWRRSFTRKKALVNGPNRRYKSTHAKEGRLLIGLQDGRLPLV